MPGPILTTLAARQEKIPRQGIPLSSLHHARSSEESRNLYEATDSSGTTLFTPPFRRSFPWRAPSITLLRPLLQHFHSSLCASILPAHSETSGYKTLASAHRVMGVRSARPRGLEVRAGKKKGNKGKSSDNGTQRSASDAKKSVRKGAAYEQETRKTALSMQARSSRPIPPTAGR